MLTLVLRDLQYRASRVVVVAALMAIIITLLFVMTGLVNQFNSEPVLATERAGGTLNWIVPDSSTGPLSSPRAAAPGAIESIDGAEPVLIGLASLNGLRATVIGRAQLGDQPIISDGRYPTAAGELLVDDSFGATVGDTVDLAGRTATVVGITTDATVLAGVPLVFTELETAQAAIANRAPVVTAGLVEGTPASLPQGLRLMSAEEVGEDALVPLLNAISSVDLVRALLWLITLIIISAVIYITALERTRDFAVLKAVGANDRSLALSLIIQGILMTLLAVAIAAVLQLFIAPLFPMTVRVPAKAFWQIPLGGTIVALIAGIAGARKAAGTPAAEAFE